MHHRAKMVTTIGDIKGYTTTISPPKKTKKNFDSNKFCFHLKDFFFGFFFIKHFQDRAEFLVDHVAPLLNFINFILNFFPK